MFRLIQTIPKVIVPFLIHRHIDGKEIRISLGENKSTIRMQGFMFNLLLWLEQIPDLCVIFDCKQRNGAILHNPRLFYLFEFYLLCCHCGDVLGLN